ncbi:hypothetical protein [Cupriavidus campinensis]
MALQDPQDNQLGTAPIDPGAEANRPAPPGVTPEQEEQFYESAGVQYRLMHNQQNLGLLGKLFGNGSAAQTNIAGMVILLCFLFLVGSYFLPAGADAGNIRTVLVGLIGSALGFIFGSRQK